MDNPRASSWSVDVHDRVFSVEFAPFNWCASLIAIGTRNRVIIGNCTFPEDDDGDSDGMQFESLKEFSHGTRVDAITWSPQTSLAIVPRIITFATAGGDRKIRLFSSDTKSEDHVEIIDGHTGFINSVAFEPVKGDQIASASDDHTCRIWNLKGNCEVCFPLQSPGMVVLWHKDEPDRVLVGEKTGIIRIYSLKMQQPIRSLYSSHSPLTSVDWCAVDVMKVACTAATNWIAWDLSQSSRPAETKSVHTEIALKFRWSSANENLIATIGRPNNQIRVIHMKSNQIYLNSSLTIVGGLSWHLHLPVLVVGGDRKVHFWLIEGL